MTADLKLSKEQIDLLQSDWAIAIGISPESFGQLCDQAVEAIALAAQVERRRGEIERLRMEVVNRNQRALDGDKSVAAFDAEFNRAETAESLVAELRARVAEQKWMPIESAPKGGGADDVRDPKYVTPPRILMRFGGEAVSVAYWDAYYATGGGGCTDGFAWCEPCSGDPLNMHYSTPPDGWQPLRPPDAAPI